MRHSLKEILLVNYKYLATHIFELYLTIILYFFNYIKISQILLYMEVFKRLD